MPAASASERPFTGLVGRVERNGRARSGAASIIGGYAASFTAPGFARR